MGPENWLLVANQLRAGKVEGFGFVGHVMSCPHFEGRAYAYSPCDACFSHRLKVDIEGAEYNLLPCLAQFKDAGATCVGWLLDDLQQKQSTRINPLIDTVESVDRLDSIGRGMDLFGVWKTVLGFSMADASRSHVGQTWRDVINFFVRANIQNMVECSKMFNPIYALYLYIVIYIQLYTYIYILYNL